MLLTEKREKLASELATVESEIGRIAGDFAPTSGKTASRTVRREKITEKRAKRGSVQSLILEGLKAAGDAGISVKDLSTKLGIKNRNVHVWLNTTGKKMKEIQKPSTGLYKFVATTPATTPLTSPKRTSARGKQRRPR